MSPFSCLLPSHQASPLWAAGKDKLAEQEQVQLSHVHPNDFTQHGTGGGTTQRVLAELRINSETDPDREAVTGARSINIES